MNPSRNILVGRLGWGISPSLGFYLMYDRRIQKNMDIHPMFRTGFEPTTPVFVLSKTYAPQTTPWHTFTLSVSCVRMRMFPLLLLRTVCAVRVIELQISRFVCSI